MFVVAALSGVSQPTQYVATNAFHPDPSSDEGWCVEQFCAAQAAGGALGMLTEFLIIPYVALAKHVINVFLNVEN